jgi:hypothetical protein
VWRYIKSAFLVSVDVPALGRVPVNILLASGFVILGFAQPAFWFLGAAAEATIVTALAFNPRFQKYVEAQHLQLAKDDAGSKRQALIQLLSPESRRRVSNLAAKCNSVLEVYRSQQAEDYIVDSNRDALDSLQWVYLKLLVAQYHLVSPTNNETEQSLDAKIRSLEADLNDTNKDETESLRQSESATLAILKKRLVNIRRKAQSLEEIDSDLTRIEAQVDLILENATMQGKPQTISTDIELASDLLGAGVFGDNETAITDLDQKYGKSKIKAQRQETVQ